MHIARILLFLSTFFIGDSIVMACDPCALTNVFGSAEHSSEGLVVGIQDQYTNFRKGDDSSFYSLKNGEVIRGLNTTQVSGVYGVGDGIALALNVPFIVRLFDDVENYNRSYNSDAGLGDISLLASYSVGIVNNANTKLSLGVFSGVKLPTGDTGTIGEVTESDSSKHHVIGGLGGSAGRLFAFGTGSVDFPLGFQTQLIYSRFYLPAFAQYNFKTEGSYEYQFADDLTAIVSPGYFVVLEDDFALSTHVMVYSEFKEADKFEGKREDQSSYSNFYVGPNILISSESDLSFDFSVLFRTTEEDNAIVVPDMRVKVGLVKKF